MSYPATTEDILLEITLERVAQDAKWGQLDHNPERWLAILGEEFGELAQAVLRLIFKGPGAAANLRTEAIQVAAVAVAMLECCARNDWMEEHDKD